MIASNTYYSRQLQLEGIGEQGQAKLQAAKVLIIGAGGLGCPILQYLATAGIGTLGIVDADAVSVSNLHRQILYTTADVGEFKVLAAKKRLEAMNPFIKIETYTEMLSTSNAVALFSEYDIIVDGSDNFATRYLVNDAAVLTQKPVVMGSIFQYEGQVTVYNYKNGPTYRCLYPEAPAAGSVPNCATIGVLGVLPGMVGCVQANEVLKLICHYGKPLSGSLWTLDSRNMQTLIFQYEKNKTLSINRLQENYNNDCSVLPEITWETLEKQSIPLLDVRTMEEYKAGHLEALHIPLQELETEKAQLENFESLAVYCQSGIRSRKAVALLQAWYPGLKVYSVQGGLASKGTL
ncbi:adenylyltransferase and sulfurtransferase [Pustulibacterium marinum]|uniref:Molybdopterin-synthase adenylyltransferase n=1 Tax=Pustulibacterium marinum TaxID=1224947 RepID=A0A1I7GAX3_9FLAO|nr:HesA/MoeB/ThiF family protein [Pustulibacterium marinum]SFU45565.1 adenylyltransferase and sulfurtransferase [Pustulibacterium marinum]